MNRIDRLFALLLELRGSGWIRAEALAHTFGISVRTVYRDIVALNESGVPVVSLPGKGYRLLDGYFLPPLHFTAPEALMLTLGADAASGAFDLEYATAATSALRKLTAALSDEQRVEVDLLRQALRIVPPQEAGDAQILRSLRRAVLLRRVASFEYHKPHGSPEWREAYPLRLVHLYGSWVLSAFDVTRAALRIFRLSRIEHLEIRPQTFTRDPTWETLRPPGQERRDMTVRLELSPHLRRPLQERPSPFRTACQDCGDHVEVTLQVRDIRDVLPWILSWGADARVFEPKELQEVVREQARRILLT